MNRLPKDDAQRPAGRIIRSLEELQAMSRLLERLIREALDQQGSDSPETE